MVAMNETSEKLIRELAEKFGTTAEHLWGVLIKQAPVSSAVNLCFFIALGLVLKKAFKVVSAKADDSFNTETHKTIGRVVWWIAAIAVLLILGCELERTAAGFFNPEFWALKTILSK